MASATRCEKCGSTSRDNYYGIVTHKINGADDKGKPFTVVKWRRTRCKKCGQTRIDKTFENPEAAKNA